MDSPTFRSRVLKLLQRSRKALRLYSSMERSRADERAEFSEAQVREWRAVNAELVKQLTLVLENTNIRRLASDTYALRDRFHSDWRHCESELRGMQKDLIRAAEDSDFSRAVSLSQKLVGLKARVQACQAAHHELSQVIARSRVSAPAVELAVEKEKKEFMPREGAKVIPLTRPQRKRG